MAYKNTVKHKKARERFYSKCFDAGALCCERGITLIEIPEYPRPRDEEGLREHVIQSLQNQGVTIP